MLRQKIEMEGRLLQLEMAGRKTYSNGKLKAYENPIRKTNEKVKTLVISGLEAEQREKIERKIRFVFDFYIGYILWRLITLFCF